MKTPIIRPEDIPKEDLPVNPPVEIRAGKYKHTRAYNAKMRAEAAKKKRIAKHEKEMFGDPLVSPLIRDLPVEPELKISISAILKAKMAKKAPRSERSYAELISDALLDLAAQGNVRALEEVLNRVDGKVTERQVEHKLPVTLIWTAVGDCPKPIIPENPKEEVIDAPNDSVETNTIHEDIRSEPEVQGESSS